MAAEFRALPDLEIADYNEVLPLGPEDLRHGTLDNGLKYGSLSVGIQSLGSLALTVLPYRFYVKTCAKPQKRAALALAVRIGSAVERDDEQGVAHMVEHLAFNATEVRCYSCGLLTKCNQTQPAIAQLTHACCTIVTAATVLLMEAVFAYCFFSTLDRHCSTQT